MTLSWILTGAGAGPIAGPRIRASVFSRSTDHGQPPRRACAREILPDRWRWRSLLPVTGRCPSCRVRIGPYLLLAELTAGFALAVTAARASSAWELAALVWLVLLAVPLAFIDVAVHRLPDQLTAAAFGGTLGLLAVAALTAHQPSHLGRAAIGAAALACLYLALSVIRPGDMGLGDAKLAASAGAAASSAARTTITARMIPLPVPPPVTGAASPSAPTTGKRSITARTGGACNSSAPRSVPA